MERTKRAQVYWILLPLALCILIMLPRLLSPQFGMLDDGATLTQASRITAGDWSLNYDGDTGRFRPMYWLVPALVYRLAGAHPFSFFAANLLILLAITATAGALARRLGASNIQAAAVCALFVLTGAVIENTYTLSKGEPLQLLWLLLAVLASTPLLNPQASIKKLAGQTLLSALLIFFAVISKETSLVILPITGGWLVVELLTARWAHREPRWRWFGSLLAASLIGASGYALSRTALAPFGLGGGSYTGGYIFTAEAVKASLVRWAGWLLRDDPHLLPLILLWVILLLAQKKVKFPDALLCLLVWMAGWMVIYLPWTYTQEYYMLPFALGASALTVLLVVQALQTPRLRLISGVLLTAAALLWLTTLPNHWTNARIQLAVDSANAEMLDTLEKLPKSSNIALNIQAPNEYTTELDLLIRQVRGRSDLQLTTFNPALPPTQGVILTPDIQNQPLLTVRMGVFEPSLYTWNQSLQSYLGKTVQPQTKIERRFQLFVIDLPRVFCPLISKRSFCAVSRPLVDTRTFVYGWALYPAPRP